MTKLMDWLSILLPVFALWYALVSKKIFKDFAEDNQTLIIYSPIIAVLLFGIYAASVVFYRVFTFNDCEEAAKELHKEIHEARDDLKRLGFVFNNANN